MDEELGMELEAIEKRIQDGLDSGEMSDDEIAQVSGVLLGTMTSISEILDRG